MTKEKPFKLKGVADFVVARVKRLQDNSGDLSQYTTGVYIRQAFEEWEAQEEAPAKPMKRIVSVAIRPKCSIPMDDIKI